ncbi:MAG: FMN-binding protein [Nitrospiraceae bacterium]
MLTFIAYHLGTLAVVSLLSATSLWAEQVWDAELKRYLTPQEMGQEDVYLTEDEAARLMFPKSDRIGREVMRLPPEKKQIVEERIGWHFPEEQFTVFIGRTEDRIDGYAVVQNTIGKHKPITYMVGVDPNGEVLNIEVLVYRESRGSEVRTKRFNAQYEGKTVFDPIRMNKDIISISGATMSVRSLSAGVKRALVIVDEIYLKPLGNGSDSAHVQKRQQGFWKDLFGF